MIDRLFEGKNHQEYDQDEILFQVNGCQYGKDPKQKLMQQETINWEYNDFVLVCHIL